MRAIPGGLIEAVAGRVEGRPWWTVDTSINGWSRRDGILVGVEPPEWMHGLLRSASMYATAPTRDAGLALLAQVDAHHSLPRPPWRAGQVWSTADGAHVRVILTNRPPKQHASLSILLYDPLFPNCAPWSAPEITRHSKVRRPASPPSPGSWCARVLDAMRAEPDREWSVGELARSMQATSLTLSTRLARLVRRGFVVRTGTAPHSRYRLATATT